MRNFFGILFLVAIGAGIFGWVAYRYHASQEGIVITLAKTEAAPFSLLEIKGKSFDLKAEVTAVFTRPDGTVLVSPAMEHTADQIEVVVPPFFDADGQPTAETVKVRVIQVARSAETKRILTKTSNEITGFRAAVLPTLNEKTPKGALSAIQVAVAMDFIDDMLANTPATEKDLRQTLTKYRSGLEKTYEEFSKVARDQTAVAVIPTADGEVKLGAADLAVLDRIYYGINQQAGVAAPTARGGWREMLLPVARAETQTWCNQAVKNLGGTDINLVYCNSREKALEEVLPEAGKAIQKGAEFSYKIGTELVINPVEGLKEAGKFVAKEAFATQIAEANALAQKVWKEANKSAGGLAQESWAKTSSFLAYCYAYAKAAMDKMGNSLSDARLPTMDLLRKQWQAWVGEGTTTGKTPGTIMPPQTGKGGPWQYDVEADDQIMTYTITPPSGKGENDQPEADTQPSVKPASPPVEPGLSAPTQPQPAPATPKPAKPPTPAPTPAGGCPGGLQACGVSCIPTNALCCNANLYCLQPGASCAPLGGTCHDCPAGQKFCGMFCIDAAQKCQQGGAAPAPAPAPAPKTASTWSGTLNGQYPLGPGCVVGTWTYTMSLTLNIPEDLYSFISKHKFSMGGTGSLNISASVPDQRQATDWYNRRCPSSQIPGETVTVNVDAEIYEDYLQVHSNPPQSIDPAYWISDDGVKQYFDHATGLQLDFTNVTPTAVSGTWGYIGIGDIGTFTLSKR